MLVEKFDQFDCLSPVNLGFCQIVDTLVVMLDILRSVPLAPFGLKGMEELLFFCGVGFIINVVRRGGREGNTFSHPAAKQRQSSILRWQLEFLLIFRPVVCTLLQFVCFP